MSREIHRIAIAVLLMVFMPVGMVNAQYTSPSYKVEETFFGAGGELELTSPSYQAKVAAGELGLVQNGKSSSTNYQTYAGFNTTDRPTLELFVTGGAFDFGVLSTSQVKAITASFTVKSYLSSGYIVQIGGTAPKNNGYAMTNMAAAAASSPGTEQFGINFTSNSLTGPGAFGADPVQDPDASFSFGVAESGYTTTNQFKYVENQQVAHSNSASGLTQYTMSAIANISGSTPGGSYGTSLFVNAIPTF
jgi:hypothetical protein